MKEHEILRCGFTLHEHHAQLNALESQVAEHSGLSIAEVRQMTWDCFRFQLDCLVLALDANRRQR